MSSPLPSLRDAHGEATRERLLDAAVALVDQGVEPTMRALAKAAGVGERTVYRYFESRDALVIAVAPRFVGRAGIPLCARFDELDDYARDLFTVFERNANLIETMLTSPWMSAPFRKTRRDNLLALRKLVDDAFGKAKASDRASATTSLRSMLSGSGWLYLRRSCQLENEAIIEHAQWLIAAVRARLENLAKAPR
ncbi:MAG: helix-turn-helix transcriptional regulator [Myxococcales bacterium]|nr:helix-turn-helix transcriptional regulator [Myxococcales bacterium]